ncbi:MAG: alkaline phosphatase D family protein [Verrucomicrobiaceae bacterium]
MTSRRLFLSYAGSLAAVPYLGRGDEGKEAPKFASDPFSLGVASGDPDHHSVVLWTRLAPSPLVPGGGMPYESVRVRWEVAEDEGFAKIVQSGTTVAAPRLGHSVHVTPEGLEADSWFYYRFHCGAATSAVGRTRTMPARDAMPNELRFVATSCQNWEQGFFTAYEQMMADAPDLVFHLGDYLYEYAAGTNGKIRRTLGPETHSLDDYRIRYSLYRTDPLLQGMHAVCPWMVTWDDHEVDNNYANDVSERKGVDPINLLVRRANAYQAYYEMMPLRESSLPSGPRMDLYRRASFGRLAELHVLDTRQYRTDQPNGDGRDPLNAAALSEKNTLLGKEQKGWLLEGLTQSQAVWDVMAQQVMMGMHGFEKADGPPYYSMDSWAGYAAERESLMRFLGERKLLNPVVLTGDVHKAWANELRVDDRKPEEALVAAEFVATSLSSGGDGSDMMKDFEKFQAYNPCIKYHNNRRGYLLCTLTPKEYRADFMMTDQVTQLGGTTRKAATYVVEAGRRGISKA